MAALILIIACFNQINLSTARSAHRGREIGMRKVVGARRANLIRQFLGETFVLVFLSACFSIALARVMLPYFNRVAERELGLEFSLPAFLVFFLLILLTGFLSGLYPAFFLSSFKPVHTLKSNLSAGRQSKHIFRTTLVVGQFVLSIGLIVCSLIVQNQLHFIRNRKLGYNKDHVVALRMNNQTLIRSPQAFLSELSAHSSIKDATASQHLPSQITTNNYPDWDGKPENVQVSCLYGQIDDRFIDFYQMKLVEGEVVQGRFNPQKGLYAYINQSALKAFEWKEAVGKRFSFLGDEWTVAGVIQDFHSASLHEPISPVILLYAPVGNNISVRIDARNMNAAMAHIEKVWKRFLPAFPFNYSFLDEDISRMYRSEQRVGQIFSSFTLLSIFIACLGLIGLASFMAETRTKEIGIRKVLGASVTSIVIMLSKEFFKWVLISNLIAWPIAYFVLNQVLQDFAYRVNIWLFPFFISALLALIIAMITVSFQSIKAAISNPVNSLRFE
ncbi:FtsX-like permease family protein [Acidobacteriota bacterium]